MQPSIEVLFPYVFTMSSDAISGVAFIWQAINRVLFKSPPKDRLEKVALALEGQLTGFIVLG